MNIAAHSPEFAKKAGIKQSVAKEFHKADKKKEPKKADAGKPAPTPKKESAPKKGGDKKMDSKK